jgi:ABC-2 type transport system permease protein
MIRRIARKEIVDTLRDGRFRWGGVVVLGLLLVALASGWAHQREIAATHQAADEETWEHWFAQEEKNPHSAAHYGVYAFKPVTTLSLVDQGVDPYVGVATWLEAHRQNPFEYRPAQDGTAVSRFGVLTAAGVLQLLIPLLIILFAFSSLSGERESGTLRQLLSVGVSPRDLVWGKALGIAGALALLLVPAAVIGALTLTLASGAEGRPEVGAVLLLAATYLAYFAIFIGVTLALSGWARASRTALVGLLAFWILNALIAPRAVADLAETVHPLPSTAEFDEAIRVSTQSGLEGEVDAAERSRLLVETVLAEYGASSLQELPINFAGVSLQAGEDYGNRVFDHHYGHLASTLEDQQTVHRRAAVVAPLLATRNLSMALAGTDVARHRHFVTAAEEHRRLIQRIMNEDITYNSRWGDEHIAGPELWASVPRFEYQPPQLGSTLGRSAGDAGVLLFWLAGVVLMLSAAAGRLRPE